MRNNVDFERAILALDSARLTTFLLSTIDMYLEYVKIHGHSSDSAKWAAINEMVDGTQAMVEMADEEAL